MAIRSQDITAALSRNRLVVETVAVAVVALAGALVLGLKARRQVAEYVAGTARLQSVARQVQEVQATFRPAAVAENARLGTPVDSAGAAISHTARLALAE